MGAAIRPLVTLNSDHLGHHDLTLTPKRLVAINNNQGLMAEIFESTREVILDESIPKMQRRLVKGLQSLGVELVIPTVPFV